MSLAQKCVESSTCPTVNIGSLDAEKPYPITHAQGVGTRFGTTVLTSIRESEFALWKEFLPRRYSEVITDEDIERFNEGKLNLIYNDVCVRVCVSRRTAFYCSSPEKRLLLAALMDFLLFNDVSLLPMDSIFDSV
jgi:hypothetical protein